MDNPRHCRGSQSWLMARAFIHSATKFTQKSEAASSAWLRRNARACRPWGACQFANEVCKTLWQKGRSFWDPIEAHHWTSNLALLVFILLQPLQPSCGQSCRLDKSPVDIPCHAVLWNCFKTCVAGYKLKKIIGLAVTSAWDFLMWRRVEFFTLWICCGSLFDFLEYSSWSWQCPFPERCLPASQQAKCGENPRMRPKLV